MSASIPPHCFVVSAAIHCFLSYSSVHQVIISIEHNRTDLGASLASDLGLISAWSSANFVCFSRPKTFLLSDSLKHFYPPQLNFGSTSFHSTRSLCWSPVLLPVSSRAARKASFLFCTRHLFTLTISFYAKRKSAPHMNTAVMCGAELPLPLFLLMGFNEELFG